MIVDGPWSKVVPPVNDPKEVNLGLSMARQVLVVSTVRIPTPKIKFVVNKDHVLCPLEA